MPSADSWTAVEAAPWVLLGLLATVTALVVLFVCLTGRNDK